MCCVSLSFFFFCNVTATTEIYTLSLHDASSVRTIFTPPHPKIRPELAEILEAEAAMPGLAALEAEAAESAERIRIRITDQVEFEG